MDTAYQGGAILLRTTRQDQRDARQAHLRKAGGRALKPSQKPDHESHLFDPIKNPQDIDRIRAKLQDNPRDLLLFNLALETGIGMKKLLQLTAKHLTQIPVGGKIDVAPSPTGKYDVVMTKNVFDAFQTYRSQLHPKPDDYLFRSKKGGRPLNLSSVSNMIKGWFKNAGIPGSFCAISLRKTWEYHRTSAPSLDEATAETGLKGIFNPIQTSSVQKIIYNKLITAIISGKIVPGTRLTTTEISKSFGVSHAPVRVALNWLEAKGFIEAQKKTGSTVKELSIGELHEIIKIRIILETAAMKLAYKACSDETIRLLSTIHKSYETAGSFEESDLLNRKFHQTLYRDAGMPMLVSLIIDLYDRFSPYAAVSYSRVGNILDTSENSPAYYLEKILAGLRDKNLPEVLKYLKMKINRGTLITEEILKERKARRP